MTDRPPTPDAARDDVASFVRGYAPGQARRIQFAWNGKHASDFFDSNQDFRAAVVEYVRAHPGEASAELLTDLFRESASWAREAWGTPAGFEELAAALLTRRGEDALADFRWGLGRSFDTFGACHAMALDPALARKLQAAAEGAITAAPTEDRNSWEALRDLFASLAAGTATQGWMKVVG